MGVRTISRLVMAGLFVAGGLLAVVGGVVGSGDDPLAGAAAALWLTGVGLVVLGAAAGGYSLVATAPVWLRLVASAGSAGLAVVVITTVVPGLDAGAGSAIVVGVLVALLGGAVGLVTQRSAAPAHGGTGLTT